MGIIDRLFGSSKTLENGTKMLDNAFYTEQEKAAGHIKLLGAYEPFKLAQRLIAMYVVPAWVGSCLLVFGLSFWMTKESLAFPLEILEGKLGTAAVIIIGFYFAGGTINGFRK